jgi:hypothetical protein
VYAKCCPFIVQLNGEDASLYGARSKDQMLKVMQGILDQNVIAESLVDKTNGSFGSKIGLFVKIFGCWHKELSRPFTNKKGSYRACLNCGARKHFDVKSFKTLGTFYYPPSVTFDRN